MRDRKLIIILVATFIFAFGVIIWYFFHSQTTENPTINIPNNPFGVIFQKKPGSEFVTTQTGSEGTEGETEITPLEDRVLYQIWNKPVAGYAFIQRDILVEGTSTTITASSTIKKSKPVKKTVGYILFVDRLTGHIHGYNTEKHTLFQITNTTLPAIYDAYIVANGTRVFMRYLDKDNTTIRTLGATIPTFSEGLEPKPLTENTTLQDNITSFAVSASSNAYSYLTQGASGSTIYSLNPKGVTSVTTSPFREWNLIYGGEAPYITTKATAYVEGSMLTLPDKHYIIGSKTGLMTTPDTAGDHTLASMWSSKGLATFVFSKKTATNTVLDIKTLASKCAWSDGVSAICAVPTTLPQDSTQGLPDDWFQGSVSFSDDLYLVFTSQSGWSSSAGTSLLYSLHEQDGAPFDVTRPKINTDATGLLFTKKQDGTLWLVDLSKVVRPE